MREVLPSNLASTDPADIEVANKTTANIFNIISLLRFGIFVRRSPGLQIAAAGDRTIVEFVR